MRLLWLGLVLLGALGLIKQELIATFISLCCLIYERTANWNVLDICMRVYKKIAFDVVVDGSYNFEVD